jgi:integrase
MRPSSKTGPLTGQGVIQSGQQGGYIRLHGPSHNAPSSLRGALALYLARGSAVVFGNREGGFRHPETFSKLFREAQERCPRMVGEDALPRIRLHDLRHTHATLLLRDRESPNVVSERLGHASVAVTLSIYAHVMPGDQKAAAARFAALVRGAEA